jgi:hypothetical protein
MKLLSDQWILRHVLRFQPRRAKHHAKRDRVVVPHFDNHPLATRPVYMDDNARPHRSRAVTTYLQSEAVTSVPWPAMSPDLNDVPWGIGCILVSPNPHPAVGYMKQKPALV